MSVIWQCLAYSNSCVNPIIYNHTSKDFRDAFRGAFSTRRGRHSESSRHFDEGTTRAMSRFGRSAFGQQRSMKAVDAADDVGATPMNMENLQQQQQKNGADDISSLSDCCNRIHLED